VENLDAIVGLADKYPLFQVSLGFMRRQIVVCDPAMAATVLVNAEVFMHKPYDQNRCLNEVIHLCDF